MRIIALKNFSRLLLSAALALSFATGCGLFGGGKDYVLVIDTSGSMAYRPGGDASKIDKVKQSMDAFLRSVDDGDTITLMNFDTETYRVGSYKINGDEDRARVVSAVETLAAKGRHTFMKGMVGSVREEVERLESQDRNVFVVIMSDGRDDPPAELKDQKLNIEDLKDPSETRDRPVQNAYIYYVSLGKLKDPALEAKLEELSPEVKTVEPAKKKSAEPKQAAPASDSESGDAAATEAETADDSAAAATADDGEAQDESAAAADEIGLTEVSEDVDEVQWKTRYGAWAPIIRNVLLVLFILGVLIILIRWFMNRHKVAGAFTYYEADVGQPVKSSFDLDKLDKSKMSIGSKLGADLKIRQMGLPKNVDLKAKKVKGESILKPAGRDEAHFKYIKQKEDGLISRGDSFRLGNYIFEYNDGGE